MFKDTMFSIKSFRSKDRLGILHHIYDQYIKTMVSLKIPILMSTYYIWYMENNLFII